MILINFNFNSFQHPSIKNSVCKTLINRAKTICEVGLSNIDNELEHLRNALKLNGYPRQIIYRQSYENATTSTTED